MLTVHTADGVTWYDLESPTPEEVHSLTKKLDISPVIANDILSPTSTPTIDSQGDWTYIVMHFPVHDQSRHIDKQKEVDFLVSHEAIVTVRYEVIDPLHVFSKLFDVNSVLKKQSFKGGGGSILFYMLGQFYHNLESEIAAICDNLTTIERNIFKGKERENVEQLSMTSLNLLSFQQTLHNQETIIDWLEGRHVTVFKGDFSKAIKEIHRRHHQALRQITLAQSFLQEVRQTNDSLLSAKQNHVVQLLTIITALSIPPSVIATIFGMSTIHSPIVGASFDFYIILAIMAACSTALFAYFKWKKWI